MPMVATATLTTFTGTTNMTLQGFNKIFFLKTIVEFDHVDLLAWLLKSYK